MAKAHQPVRKPGGNLRVENERVESVTNNIKAIDAIGPSAAPPPNTSAPRGKEGSGETNARGRESHVLHEIKIPPK